MAKKDVIKHSAAVQVSNKINLLQRKAWNILLANAYDELPEKEIFEVDIKELMEVMNYGSKHDKHLKDTLEALVDCKIKWNILEKDGEYEWGIATLLAEAKIKGGKLSYAYSPTLRQRLYNPSMYARISLSMQNRFDSKHSLALYELAVDYFIKKQSKGETPWISITDYRKLMGVAGNEYPEFKKLNKWVIKDPLKEINEKSDLFVEVKYRKEMRKVTAIKLYVKPNLNKNDLLEKIVKITEAKPKIVTMSLTAPKGEVIYDRLVKYFLLSPAQANEVIEKYDPEYIEAKLAGMEEKLRNGEQINNLGAYTYKAIMEGYQFGESQFEKDKKITKKNQEEKNKLLEKLKQDHAKELKAKILAAKERIDENEMAGLMDEFERKHVNNILIKSRWEKEKLDNPMVAGLFDMFFKERFLSPEDYDFSLWLKANTNLLGSVG